VKNLELRVMIRFASSLWFGKLTMNVTNTPFNSKSSQAT